MATSTAMKTLLRITYFALVYGFLSAASPAAGESPSTPYFQIVGNSDERPDEQLPLKSSAAKVSIDGTIARVRLTQKYANSGSVPIEAIYVFPASTHAAVHGMTLTTGGRVIAARVKESVKAKAEYETAKAEKKTAALLEEHRPNVFQMSVANLLPGDDIDVEIEWTETIPAVDSTYEFVFPTVVGPRYTGGSAAAKGLDSRSNPGAGRPFTWSPRIASLSACSISTSVRMPPISSGNAIRRARAFAHFPSWPYGIFRHMLLGTPSLVHCTYSSQRAEAVKGTRWPPTFFQTVQVALVGLGVLSSAGRNWMSSMPAQRPLRWAMARMIYPCWLRRAWVWPFTLNPWFVKLPPVL